MSLNNLSFLPLYRKKDDVLHDFYIPALNTCIEFQGIQHYENCWFTHDNSLQVRQLRDKIKKEYCKQHGITLIEVKYNENVDDVLRVLI